VTKRLSVMGVLILSMCSYILRFLIYASIRNPWQGLPAEALRGFTFAAMWASSTYYTHRISPPGLSATMVRCLALPCVLDCRVESIQVDSSRFEAVGLAAELAQTTAHPLTDPAFRLLSYPAPPPPSNPTHNHQPHPQPTTKNSWGF
jgi:hypothetical protein